MRKRSRLSALLIACVAVVASVAALVVVIGASDDLLSDAELQGVRETVLAHERGRFTIYTVPQPVLGSVLEQRKALLEPRKDELLAETQKTGQYPRAIVLPKDVLAEVADEYEAAMKATCSAAYLVEQVESNPATSLLDIVNNPVPEDGVPAVVEHAVLDVTAAKALPGGRYAIHCTVWRGEVDVLDDRSERRIDIWHQWSYTVEKSSDGGWAIVSRSRIATAQDASQAEYGPKSPACTFSTGI